MLTPAADGDGAVAVVDHDRRLAGPASARAGWRPRHRSARCRRSCAPGRGRSRPVRGQRPHERGERLPVGARHSASARRRRAFDPSRCSRRRTGSLTIRTSMAASVRPLGSGRSEAASSRPRPRLSSTLTATLRTNHGELRELAGPRCRTRRPDAGPARSARYRTQRTGPADVAEPPPEHQLAHDRERHADRRERVVDQQLAAVGDPGPPVADVAPGPGGSGGRRRCTARRSTRGRRRGRRSENSGT